MAFLEPTMQSGLWTLFNWLDAELVPWTSRWPPLAGTLWAQKWASSEKNPGMIVGGRDSGLANSKNVHLGFSQNPLS